MGPFLKSIFYALPISVICTACAITRPCTDGGDISWNPKIVGDKKCAQKTYPDGHVLNQGKFQETYESTGTLALDGNFEEGKKEGIWLYYAEDQHLVAAKFFDHGVEKTPPLEVQKKIDLIIQQKAGMR